MWKKYKKGVKLMQVIVGGIIEKEGKFLMVQEAKKKCYGKWNFPAGHLEEGEKIYDGAIREIFEETGCKVRLTNVLPIINTELEDVNFILINFVAELVEEDIKFNKEEILDVKWIDKKDIEEMDYNSLRDEKLIKRTLEIFEENKIYTLDVIEILKK